MVGCVGSAGCVGFVGATGVRGALGSIGVFGFTGIAFGWAGFCCVRVPLTVFLLRAFREVSVFGLAVWSGWSSCCLVVVAPVCAKAAAENRRNRAVFRIKTSVVSKQFAGRAGTKRTVVPSLLLSEA